MKYILVCLALLPTACASIYSHRELGIARNNAFIGVRNDYDTIIHLPHDIEHGTFLSIFDLPLSLVADILILPADLLTAPKYASLRRLFPTEPIIYRDVRDAHDWLNPYLVVGPKSIEVRGVVSVTPKDIKFDRLIPKTDWHHGTEVRGVVSVAPEDIEIALANLPRNAWHYGKVVAVQELGIRSGRDDKMIRENVAKVMRVLMKYKIRAELWPSS